MLPDLKEKLQRIMAGRGSSIRHLEAFLTAFPGEYCGFSQKSGAVVYSEKFADMLGLKKIETADDIQNCLDVSDAAAFEGLYNRLRHEGEPFTLNVKSHSSEKVYKITGSRGSDQAGEEFFNVLWVEDISDQARKDNQNRESYSALEQERDRFKSTLDNIPAPLWLRDSQQNLVWVNASYAQYLNLAHEDILKDQKEIITPPRKKAKGAPKTVKDMAALAVKRKEPQYMRSHVIAGGERKYMAVGEIPLKQKDMGAATLGIAQDITAQEDLESEMKRAKASNRDLLEQLSTAISTYDVDKRLEFYNSAFAQLWGLEDQWLNTGPKLGEIMEKLREDRRLPEQADFRSFKKSWLNMFTSLIDAHEEMLYLPDGTALRMLVVPQTAGGLIMTFEDVTSRLELESSYNTLIAVQKETLDNLAEGVAVYGGDGRLKLWNPSFGRLWKLNPEDLEGEPHISRVVEKKRQVFDEGSWEQTREDLISITLDRSMREGRLEHLDGTLVEYSSVPLPDGGVLVTFADVTDTVRVENALREKNAALEAAEKLKLDFLANVSYQLRTPLSAIMGFNDILDQEYFGKLNARQKEYTKDISDASHKLLDLINNILDLSTIEAGYLELEYDDVDVAAMLENLVELTREWARKEKIEVVLQCPENIGTIEADERRIKQALVNLIRNSIAFTPEGGSIEISALTHEDGVSLAVKDSGIGIKRENQMRIFKPFERAQRGLTHAAQKGRSAGAGLGLSLVKNIVNLHGGQLDLKSEPGEGTLVTIFLPYQVKETTDKQKIKLSLIN